MINFQQEQIRGLNIATSQMPHMGSVSAGFFIPVGSRFESESENGVAHFLEHMIFKGTNTRDALNLAMAIEGAGGTINAFTSEDQTCIETRGPADLLPDFIEIMSDMIWNSLMDPHEIEVEREVIKEEIIMYEENPSDHLDDILSQTLWPQHPLGRPITGTEESVNSICRPSLVSFSDRYYRSKGIALSVAGNIKHSDVAKLATKFVPDLSSSLPTPRLFDHSVKNSELFGLNAEQREIEQTHLALGFHTEGRHSSDRHTVQLLSLLMGETMISRLFQELREKRGICYSVSTDYGLHRETGSFEISIGLDTDRLTECLQAIAELLTNIKKHGFTDQEIRQAKRYADGQASIALETPSSRMSWMGDSLNCYDRILDPLISRGKLALINTATLSALAAKTFNLSNMAAAAVSSLNHSEIKTQILQNLKF